MHCKKVLPEMAEPFYCGILLFDRINDLAEWKTRPNFERLFHGFVVSLDSPENSSIIEM